MIPFLLITVALLAAYAGVLVVAVPLGATGAVLWGLRRY